MSEAFDRVRGVRELPLFPLPLVLFPGVPLPLHIFEPRYRRMLEDIRARNNLFGLSYFDASASAEREFPPVGHVGCVAEVVEAQALPDGRSNILTVGLIRYRLDAYVDTADPYLVGRVTCFEDEADDEQLLAARAAEVSDLFTRIARAVRTINDDRTGLPDLPGTDPERLSFLVAAAMELDLEVKQELLETRSTAARLARIGEMLSQVVGNYEERARAHTVARKNGHAGKHLDLDE
ncbi:MAG TPA: LON peptidase substrate-binding domain-containing protein [Pyrinomonadaceae bacterium]|nr:LON peptidase substrate-binding domain-containing protein [Pyrinomonadaceae bacterium]